MTQPYNIVSSTSALSIRILNSREALGRSVVQFEGEYPEAAPRVVYASVDLDGQVGIVVDVPPEVYKLVHLVVHLASCLYVEYGAVDSGIPFTRNKHMISVLASDTVRPNAAHTTTTTPIIFLGCSGDCETTPASSAQSMPQGSVARTDSPVVASPRPLFLPQAYQRVHDAFVCLETRVGHVYNSREIC